VYFPKERVEIVTGLLYCSSLNGTTVHVNDEMCSESSVEREESRR